jgi:hypothetical protein
MTTDGHYFTDTLQSINFETEEEKSDTVRNAKNIVSEIIKAYGGSPESGIDPAQTPTRPITGLVYGRIQSGKTRAMISSTAMAFDNGFRIVVVMTSNINDLVDQTHIDFSSGLRGVMTFTKDNDLDREAQNVKVNLEIGDGRLLLVSSKARRSLENISRFLEQIGAENFPAIIFDDEGDQASLDTNTRLRSQTTNVLVAPSAVNSAIQNTLRSSLPRHVYVSVTGTPQAVLLQSADSASRPSFIVMLPPGATYIGGDRFFNTEEPEDNIDHLIAIVDQNEKEQLLDVRGGIPEGLRRSILFFIVAAAAAIKNKGVPPRGYSYLCHPSLKNDEQSIAERKINDFLIEVAKVLLDGTQSEAISRGLQEAYDELCRTLKDSAPSFDEIKKIVSEQLATRRLLVINARVRRHGIEYGQGINFLIGGNTLGRGIAIRDLLVTYYIRDSKISQIDTMHQHARMFGYRGKTFEYTRLFIPRHLYYRFRDIHDSDQDLRAFIEKHKDELPATFPVEYTDDLRTTRRGVLDVNRTDTLHPGMHIFPNYIVIPQGDRSYKKVLRLLVSQFDSRSDDTNDLERAAANGKIITADEAIKLVGPIKTKSKNTWQDKTIAAVIRKLAELLGDRIQLRFRNADRLVRDEGFISTGTLAGDRLQAARAEEVPTLWIMAARSVAGSFCGEGKLFMYPTLVIPDRMEKLYMFNKG